MQTSSKTMIVKLIMFVIIFKLGALISPDTVKANSSQRLLFFFSRSFFYILLHQDLHYHAH